MAIAVITGSAGLIGSATARRLAGLGFDVVGIDNDMRGTFFGAEASTRPISDSLTSDLGARYVHHDVDIRDDATLESLFARLGHDVSVVVHAAAQPGHSQWSIGDPREEFDINARATLGLLEATRPGTAPTPPSCSAVPPRSTAIVPTSSRWSRCRPGGRSSPGTSMRTASPRTSLSMPASTPRSGCPSWRPT